jgi:hypothetical protein
VAGNPAFIIAAAGTVMNRPSEALLAEVFPGVKLYGEAGGTRIRGGADFSAAGRLACRSRLGSAGMASRWQPRYIVPRYRTVARASPDGFFDAVNPTTGAVGHRDLVLDQSMIMAALDNALDNRAIQRDFASDPVSWAARTYLLPETLSV